MVEQFFYAFGAQKITLRSSFFPLYLACMHGQTTGFRAIARPSLSFKQKRHCQSFGQLSAPTFARIASFCFPKTGHNKPVLCVLSGKSTTIFSTHTRQSGQNNTCHTHGPKRFFATSTVPETEVEVASLHVEGLEWKKSSRILSTIDSRCSSSKSGVDEGASLFIDGSALSNGMPSAQAGYGVWWGESHRLNRSGPVSGKQTNNRAELTALIFGLMSIQRNGDHTVKWTIYTDSKYAIERLAFPVNSKLSNLDLIMDAKTLDQMLRELGFGISYVYVRAHTGVFGNEKAHKLAQAAAKGAYVYWAS